MTPSRSLPLLALATLVACSSASTPTPTPPPAPSASASPTSEPASGWTPHDPRIVRCGIDDRPRNVVSKLSDAEASLPRAKIEMPQPPPPPPPPPNAAQAPSLPPGMILVDQAPIDRFEPQLIPPTPQLRIEVLPLSNPSGGPVPALAPSVDPHYEICSSLAAPNETPGPLTFGLELASSGAPLRVLPPAGDATPTPLVRCLMERACQLQATAPGQKTLLDVPLKVSRDQPPPPPPPRQVVRADVVTENPRPDVAELQLQLRAAAMGVMQLCGATPSRARVRLSLDLVSPGRRVPTRRRRNLRAMAVPMPETTIAGQRTELLEGTVSNAVLGCVVNNIRQRTFDLVLAAPRTEKMILTWNP